jgi:hypothetical protein
MTQPVGLRPPAPTRTNDDDPDVPASYRPFSPLSSWDHRSFAPIPESLARAAAVSLGVQPLAAARTQASLDRFMESTKGPYQTPDGPQWVPPPFRMPWAYSDDQAKVIAAHAQLVNDAAAKAHIPPSDVEAVRSGRGTIQQFRQLAQAIIDASEGPEKGRPWTAQNIRELLTHCGIGIDCAGYVQQAYLTMRGETREQAGFGTLANESLSSLGQRGFTHVPGVEYARPGDIMVLGAPSPGDVGHRCIVYERRLATPDEVRELYGTTGDAHEFSQSPPIYVLQLDSCWGSGGDALVGGVQRQTFFYSGCTQLWARYVPPRFGDTEGRPTFVASTQPYGHPLEGFYRGPGAAGPQ